MSPRVLYLSTQCGQKLDFGLQFSTLRKKERIDLKKVLPHIVGVLIPRAIQRTQGSFRVFGGFSKSNATVNEIVCHENERLYSFEFIRAICAHRFCDLVNIQYVEFSTIIFRLDNDEM